MDSQEITDADSQEVLTIRTNAIAMFVSPRNVLTAVKLWL